MSIQKKIEIKLSNNQAKKLGIKKDKKYLKFETELNKLANEFIQSDEYLTTYGFKPKKPKKDNSKRGDIFLNCRCCGVLIRPDWYSRIDQRYCQDCL
tara:strand:- start:785 stop:1075 length:291 start_codon:yes stop_codon:yes gene_type:complete